jgi:hypothetical protein
VKINIAKLVHELQSINRFAPKSAIARMLGRSRQRLHQIENDQNGVGIVTPKQLAQIQKVFYPENPEVFKRLVKRLSA